MKISGANLPPPCLIRVNGKFHIFFDGFPKQVPEPQDKMERFFLSYHIISLILKDINIVQICESEAESKSCPSVSETENIW